jgi:Glycosyltransferase family 87
VAVPGGVKWLRPAALVLVAAVCAYYVALGTRNAWDLETYYFAARALREGLDPYRLASLSAIAGKSIELPFLYPPAVLSLFLPLTPFPVQAATYLWLGAQCALALGLVWLWRKQFLPDTPLDLLVLVTLLGFNAALLWALRTGNLALLTTVLLWAGLVAYARGRLTAAAVLIAIGGAFKIIPLVLLALVALGPVGRGKDRAAAVICAGLVLAALLAVSWPLLPEWAGAVQRSLAFERPTGEVNPSLLGLLDGWTPRGGAGGGPALAVYAVFSLAILGLSIRPLARLRRDGASDAWIMLGVLVWLLVSPRVMVYSWVMAVPPAVFIIRRRVGSHALRSLAYGCVVLQGVARFLPGPPPGSLAGLSFFVALGLWALALGLPSRVSRTVP